MSEMVVEIISKKLENKIFVIIETITTLKGSIDEGTYKYKEYLYNIHKLSTQKKH